MRAGLDALETERPHQGQIAGDVVVLEVATHLGVRTPKLR